VTAAREAGATRAVHARFERGERQVTTANAAEEQRVRVNAGQQARRAPVPGSAGLAGETQ
jgi:hypothetical protein